MFEQDTLEEEFIIGLHHIAVLGWLFSWTW